MAGDVSAWNDGAFAHDDGRFPMGLFDFFKSKKGGSLPAQKSATESAGASLPELSYGVAYFVLPHYAHNDCEKLVEMWKNSPASAGPFYYLMACQMQKTEPINEVALCFRAHYRALDDRRDCYVMQFPEPPPFVLPTTDIEELMKIKMPVLAPYFSAVVRDRQTKSVRYYVLGQAPTGGTTLRSVGADQTNYNLGPGPNPTLEEFLAAISQPPGEAIASIHPGTK